MAGPRDLVVKRIEGTPMERAARALHGRLAKRRRPEWVRARSARYDEQTVEIISKVMKRHSNSVDAGAHRGLFTGELVRAAPDGTHFAFEPTPELADHLRLHHPRAEVHQVALSDFDGEATFRCMPGNPYESSLIERPGRERGHTVRSMTVPVRRLDSVLPPELPIAFVKVDVEDAERALFRGARRTLARWRPVVAFECDVAHLGEAMELLASCSLGVQLIDDYLGGNRRPPDEVVRMAGEQRHWFFVGSPG